MKNLTSRFLFLYISIVFYIASIIPSKSQNLNSLPSQVIISDTILLNTIKKYQRYIFNQESFIVGVEKKSDTTKYYISAIRSLYKLSKNLPINYAKIGDNFVLLYSGLESVILINTEDKNRFLKIISTRLDNDILPDGNQNPTAKSVIYDPFQVLLFTKNGERIGEDYKMGFGINGFPYFTK